jgi:hypothetical protein
MAISRARAFSSGSAGSQRGVARLLVLEDMGLWEYQLETGYFDRPRRPEAEPQKMRLESPDHLAHQ